MPWWISSPTTYNPENKLNTVGSALGVISFLQLEHGAAVSKCKLHGGNFAIQFHQYPNMSSRLRGSKQMADFVIEVPSLA